MNDHRLAHERADVGPSANLQPRTLKTLDKRPLITQEMTCRIVILSVFSGACVCVFSGRGATTRRCQTYFLATEIFTAPATDAGATQSAVWNVTAVARAAPDWNASPAARPMLALQAFGLVVHVTGMSVAEWMSTTWPLIFWF